MKLIILGSKGMLGQTVKKYFSNKQEIVEFNYRYSLDNRNQLIDEIKNSGPAYIINCIGAIKQKTGDNLKLLTANSILPLDIARILNADQVLIHPSTDCIYDGKIKGHWYDGSTPPNAEDDYGWSKILGEQAVIGHKNAFIVRVSIIGPDLISDNPKGLLAWFLSNKEGAKLKGYSDHLWNGITTLEWCKQVEKLFFNKEQELKGNIVQLGTEQRISKYHLLCLFQEVFETNFEIEPFDTGQNLNRCLMPDFFSKELKEQLLDLKTI